TNWAHYHIASEPLAPGRGGPALPGLVSTNILNLLVKNTENSYNNVDRLISDHTRWHATLNPERYILQYINAHHDLSLIKKIRFRRKTTRVDIGGRRIIKK
ncbi:hypothetical protein, partial [Enterobacter intestinihominis]